MLRSLRRVQLRGKFWPLLSIMVPLRLDGWSPTQGRSTRKRFKKRKRFRCGFVCGHCTIHQRDLHQSDVIAGSWGHLHNSAGHDLSMELSMAGTAPGTLNSVIFKDGVRCTVHLYRVAGIQVRQNIEMCAATISTLVNPPSMLTLTMS